MSVPVEEVLGRLDAAYGKLSLPDWQAHSTAIADAVEGLSDFYLHVDATTGVRDPAPIYLDESRIVFGLLPGTVAPLVRMLQEQTSTLDLALQHGWLLPPAEEPAWAHWHNRLARYVVSLERALAQPHQPSEDLWRNVTAPLLQGLYPPEFAALGIANPGAPSKPDVSTVPTTAFMVALQSREVSRVQTWLLRWREDVGMWAYNTREAVAAWFNAAGEGARAGVRSVAKTAVIGVLVSGLAFTAWKVVQTQTRDRGRRKLS